ncbi:MAG TPA: DUF58 domain-containing protein [Chthoniobacteraceae bacterium]|jgi:uncharacterized protein (DUF58 family)|nr:DUF58 domain-containing protein [Chthoniobacteraceae bacterium]
MSESRVQLTTLLTNRDLDRLGRLRINATRRFTNRARGEHLAAKGGTSTEFCDYRDYAPGDDMRFVDWNIFSRLNRPYVKQFHHEEEMHVVILIDASNSMLFEEKFELARRLAAGFAVLGLRNQEKVSVYALRTAGAPPRLAPCTGRASQAKTFAFIESIEGGGDAPIERGLEDFLRQHTGRGVVIVLSDFLTSGDLRRAFSLLHGSGLEIFALQILGPGEIDPEVTGDLRFFDSETAAHLDITAAGDLLAIYQEYRAAHRQMLETLAQQRSGRFLSISAAEPFERVFFDLLRRKGWVV